MKQITLPIGSYNIKFVKPNEIQYQCPQWGEGRTCIYQLEGKYELVSIEKNTINLKKL